MVMLWNRKPSRKARVRRNDKRFTPRCERLEDRTLPSTFIVTTTADTGPGSLRQAILNSNAAPGQTNTITFNIAPSGTQTITVESFLPIISNPVVIDGTTQPGFTNQPLIILTQGETPNLDGLRLGGAGGSTIKGLELTNFG